MWGKERNGKGGVGNSEKACSRDVKVDVQRKKKMICGREETNAKAAVCT